MHYIRNVLFGIAAAILAIVVWLAARLGTAVWEIDVSEGGGLMAVIVGTQDILLPAIIGFTLGFWWNIRRERRRADNARRPGLV